MQLPVVQAPPTPWSYSSTASWLSVTPGNGQLKGTASSVVTASVNAGGLATVTEPLLCRSLLCLRTEFAHCGGEGDSSGCTTYGTNSERVPSEPEF